MPYQQSKKFCRQSDPKKQSAKVCDFPPDGQKNLLKFVLENVEQGNLDQTIKAIDQFCMKTWMMNLGEEKGEVVDSYLKGIKAAKIIQVGGYCGYSALRFTRVQPQAKILSVEISKEFAEISRQIFKHAGVSDRINVHVGTVGTSEEVIKSNGPFDMIFIDHEKDIYLQDFRILEKYDVVRKGTLVIADNIIYPGSPDYLAAFKQDERYKSILEHSYVEYSNLPDAILFSQRL